ncbi:dTMP kinase [Erysipelotrichaceae bacterium OH741_COT-311]|nr:dTMP kinase [Erysipelotrichaceae bacterium OH741_COT-311]
MKKGLFITFEGPDGSGKTTVSKAIYEKLVSLGYDCIYTREPGGIEIAEEIRDIILNPKNTAMDYRTEALLYAASRAQHLAEKILPALKEKKIIICDRFVDSSLAYQGYARGLGIEEVYQINRFAIGQHFPDKTIFLDIHEGLGLNRVNHRGNKDRLDAESLNFHQLVKEGYRIVCDKYKDRMICIDASLELEQVIQQAFEAVMGIIHEVE